MSGGLFRFLLSSANDNVSTSIDDVLRHKSEKQDKTNAYFVNCFHQSLYQTLR
jgi:hypothetical protein